MLPEEGVPATLYNLCIPKNGPDLEAARRFVDFALGREAQALWQQKFGAPVLRDDVPPDPRRFGLRPLAEVAVTLPRPPERSLHRRAAAGAVADHEALASR